MNATRSAAALSVGAALFSLVAPAGAVEPPRPALLLWDALATPTVSVASRAVDLLDKDRGLEIPISVAPCVRVDEPGTERSKARVVVARDYFTPDGAAIVRFETPPIDSGAFPRPYGQIPQPSPIPPYSASYFWEDGTALPYYNASTPNGCQFPHSKRFTFGIANAKQQRYAVMGYALVGTYAKVTTVCPPPAPPSPPPPCSQTSVSGDASAYHLSVFELNGNRLWSLTLPGIDAEGWRISVRNGSQVADVLDDDKVDEVMIVQTRTGPGGITEQRASYYELATGNPIRQVTTAATAPSVPAGW